MKINDDDLFDSDGYLLPTESWNKNIATSVANKHGIVLSDIHWVIIGCLQEFYKEYQIIPTNRALINLVRQKDSNFSSIDFQKLFPSSPIQTACKIAGLPKPNRCI